MLSNTSKYALRAVIYLAMNDGKDSKLGIKKISNELDIPAPFLGKILQSLAKHRILTSSKGPNGGFGLGHDPENITLMDIVEVIDGRDVFEKCGIGIKYCSEQKVHCALHSRYAKHREEMKTLFNSTTIAEIVSDMKKNNSTIFI